MKTSLKQSFKAIFFIVLVCFFSAKPSFGQWADAGAGLPSSGIGSSGFAALSESSSTLWMGSLDGELYYNNFSTGVGSTNWVHVTRPSGANSPLSNICAVGSDIYVAWDNVIYLSTNSGSTWTSIATNFNPGPLNANYYQDFNTQLFGSDGTNFYYVANTSSCCGATIYKASLGSTSFTTLNSYTGWVNCFYVYGGRIYIGTNSGLFAASSGTVSGTWSTEFSGTSFSGDAVYQFVNSQYSTSYPTGTFISCSCATSLPVSSTFYPFYMVANSCTGTGACPKIIQLVEGRYGQGFASEPLSDCHFCTTCCTKYMWQSVYSYTDNSWSSGFPTNSSVGDFVTASGDVTASTAAAAKIWGLSTQSSGAENHTFVNSSAWSAGTLSGLPGTISTYNAHAAIGSHNTYDGTSGLVFFTFDIATVGHIYFLSYTSAKTSDMDNEGILTPSFDALGNSLNIYPNPATDKVTFDLSMTQNADFSLKIYDQLGREIIIPASNSYMDMGRLKLDVSLSDFPTGIYYCRLNAGTVYSGKFIKQ